MNYQIYRFLVPVLALTFLSGAPFGSDFFTRTKNKAQNRALLYIPVSNPIGDNRSVSTSECQLPEPFKNISWSPETIVEGLLNRFSEPHSCLNRYGVTVLLPFGDETNDKILARTI